MSNDESTYLACILVDPSLIFKASVTEGHFFVGVNRRIFRAMHKCADANVKIDYISIGDIDREIDPAYLVTMHDSVPSAANWRYYEGKVIDEYQRRKLVSLGKKIAELAESSAPAEVIEMAENELLELGTNGQTRKIQRAADVMPEVVKEIEARHALKGKIPGIGTGLDGLDLLLGGFQDDRYIIIGARPSDGKSALAVNMACNIGISLGLPVGLISAESSNREIMTRVVASEGRIRGERLMTGMLSSADLASLVDVGAKIKPAPIFLYDAPNIRFGELKSVARQMVTLNKIRVLFVDYVQIIRWEDPRLAIHEQVAAVSRGLKQLARELKIPIVGLSQLKRDSEGREPELADLDYSKQLEQDGDAIVLIYHPKPKEKKGEEDEREEEHRESLLLIKKNRDGAKGTVHVDFRREFVKFYEIDKYAR